MKNSGLVSCRRTFGILAAVMAVGCACGKKKESGGASKLDPPAAATDAPLTVDVARASVPAALQQVEALPAWAQESPHYFSRDGRRYASAVGWARSNSPSLSRSAAEDRARVALLAFLRGGASSGALVTGTLSGAAMTDSFTPKGDDRVFVRVEILAP